MATVRVKVVGMVSYCLRGHDARTRIVAVVQMAGLSKGLLKGDLEQYSRKRAIE